MFIRKWSGALAFAALIALSACSGDDEGSGGPTLGQGSASLSSTADDGDMPGQEDQDGTSRVPFGERLTNDDGVAISVSEPETFLPTATSVNGGEPEFVSFQVFVSNDGDAELLPTEVFVTVGSGDGQGGEVIDPDGGITGPPAEAIAPGGEASWSLAFGVLNAEDVVVRVQPGVDGGPVTFGR